jgi:hypothetical protein
MTTSSVGKNMLLVHGTWGTSKTFKMIPASMDCPYAEVLFDPESKLLAVISRFGKEVLHMVPRIDENGDPVYMKVGKRGNGKEVKEQRVTINSFFEYYIMDKKDVEDFVKMYAINADTFNYDTYMQGTGLLGGSPEIIMP